MARLRCVCGNSLSNSRSPNEIQYYAFSANQWKYLLTCGEIDVLTIPDPEGEIWRCPQCERLCWFSEGADQGQGYRKAGESPFSDHWENEEKLFRVFSDVQWDGLLWNDNVDFAKITIQPFLLKQTETGLLLFDPETQTEWTYLKD